MENWVVELKLSANEHTVKVNNHLVSSHKLTLNCMPCLT
jgi:hypothetical protein